MGSPRRPEPRSVVLSIAAILAIGYVDYATGAELRVFPLYFLPLSIAAWQAGRTWASFVAVLCSVAWLWSNRLAGLRFSSDFVMVANVAAQTIAFVVVGYLVAGLRRALLSERAISQTDELTGLANRRGFQSEVVRALATCRRHARPISIAYVDVDDFKRVNDTYGHPGGDAVLCTMARVLQSATRAGDCVARMGGDEFAVLLPEAGADGARAFADRLRSALHESLAQGPAHATVSVGAVAFEEAPDDVELMLHEADAVMYAVKSAGKNRVEVVVIERAGTAAG